MAESNLTPEEQTAANAIRDALFDLVSYHEQRHHGGELCEEGRVSLIAWLSHSIGMGVTDLPKVADSLAEYEEHHPGGRDAHGHDHEGGHEHHGPS